MCIPAYDSHVYTCLWQSCAMCIPAYGSHVLCAYLLMAVMCYVHTCLWQSCAYLLMAVMCYVHTCLWQSCAMCIPAYGSHVLCAYLLMTVMCIPAYGSHVLCAYLLMAVMCYISLQKWKPWLEIFMCMQYIQTILNVAYHALLELSVLHMCDVCDAIALCLHVCGRHLPTLFTTHSTLHACADMHVLEGGVAMLV